MVNNLTYVIGHKNPDSDSICSAIAFAALKEAEGVENIKAARAGDINPQTSFILDYFNIEPPVYLPNVFSQAKDIMSTDIITVDETTPLKRVIEIFRDKNVQYIPVISKHNIPTGFLSPMDLANMNIGQIEEKTSRTVFTSLANIAATLNANIHVDSLGSCEKLFSAYIGAMEEVSFLKVLGNNDLENRIVIVGDRERIQELSVERNVSVLIVTGGLKVSERIIRKARENNVSLIVSPYDSATTALLVRMSTPAYKLCNKEFEKASPDELVDDIKDRITQIGGHGIAVLGDGGELLGIITKSDVLKPSGISLILVDHNEVSQAVDGADKVKIEEVVDHHRLGNFHTSSPIAFMCEPVGSTSTLISERFKRNSVKISKKIAGLLLGGVLSDTVILKSPTTTIRDRNIVEWLETKSGLNHTGFGKDIFTSTSSLKKQGPYNVVNGDYKIFEIKEKKLGIGQVETIGFDEFYNEKDRLMKELAKIKEAKALRLSALLITDIVIGTSLLLTVGDDKVINSFDYPKVEVNVYELKDVLSRKKQVVPHLLNIFNSIY